MPEWEELLPAWTQHTEFAVNSLFWNRNSNESTESIPENLLCTISASKKTVLQRGQRAAGVTHVISVFYWWLTGWNLNVLILFSSIVLPAHPTLYRVSLCASQPFDGIGHVFFLSKLRLWQQAIGILYCLSSRGLKIAMQDDDETDAATSSWSSKDAVSAGKYLNLTGCSVEIPTLVYALSYPFQSVLLISDIWICENCRVVSGTLPFSEQHWNTHIEDHIFGFYFFMLEMCGTKLQKVSLRAFFFFFSKSNLRTFPLCLNL